MGKNFSAQFRDQILLTRRQIFDQENKAEARFDTAVVARSHADDDFVVAGDSLKELTRELGLAERIWKYSLHSQLSAANAAERAADAATEATAATSRIAAAADAIKDANKALETLTCDAGCIAAISAQKVRGGVLFEEACAAKEATAKAAEAAEKLMYDSLEASVDATRSTAPALATALQGLQLEFLNVASEGESTLASSLAAVAKARKVYGKTEKTYKEAYESLIEHDKDERALEAAIYHIDHRINRGLQAKVVLNPIQPLESESDLPVVLAIQATMTPPNPEKYSQVFFLAVPNKYTPTFRYSDFEDLLDEHPDRLYRLVVEECDEFQAYLTIDATTGEPLELGSKYNVFVFVQPKETDEDLNLFLSFPSPTVLFQSRLKWNPEFEIGVEIPKPGPLGGVEQFYVSLESNGVVPVHPWTESAVNIFGPMPEGLELQYRAIVVPDAVYRENKEDELFLTSLLNPAYYAEWRDLENSLTFTAGPAHNLLPNPEASFTDMYGNFIDLEESRYVVLVLVVAIDELHSVSPKPAGVLSPPSVAFPSLEPPPEGSKRESSAASKKPTGARKKKKSSPANNDAADQSEDS